MTPEQLKASIIQCAIQGKLVEQRDGEGTAEELYQQIQKEKQILIKEGKIKKSKTLPDILEEEVSFDIPETWKWIRLGEIVEIISGVSYDKKDVCKEGIRVLRGGNIQSTLVKAEDDDVFLPIGYYDDSKQVRIGDILYVASTGSKAVIGKPGFIDKDFPNTLIGAFLRICRPVSLKNTEYLKLIFSSEYYRKHIRDLAQGTNINNVKESYVTELAIPLPPLEEQKRIVSRIEELLPYVDRYAEAYEKLEHFNAKFPEDMKKSILQYAIQGKLVEQRSEEGTADGLLQQIQNKKKDLIKEGKIKKDKPLPEITEEELPFEIPDSWKWCRLRDICTKIVDGDHNPPKGTETPTEYIMLSATNINNDRIVELDKVRYITEDMFDLENQRTRVEINDIFFTIVGSMGRSCIYRGGYNICFQRSVSVITTLINQEYLKRVLDSPYIQTFMYKNATGTAQKGFYLNQVENLVIALPPLEEQHRIVAKIEELLQLCEKLAK